MNWADSWTQRRAEGLAEWSWRLMVTARLGWHQHRAHNPWKISLTTTWPRSILMCAFFTLLGRVIDGEAGASYMFVGSIAISIMLFTFAELGDVPMRDRWPSAFYRLRRGVLPVPVVYAARAWPMVAEATLLATVCLLVIGPLTGLGSLVIALLPLSPLYLVMVLTSAAAGLATASIGLFGRAGSDVFAYNIAIYLVIACSGALIPVGTAPWIDRIGMILPMRHGLEAIRAGLVGLPVRDALLTEVLVGLGWAALAVASYTYMTRRMRRTDQDKVA